MWLILNTQKYENITFNYCLRPYWCHHFLHSHGFANP